MRACNVIETLALICRYIPNDDVPAGALPPGLVESLVTWIEIGADTFRVIVVFIPMFGLVWVTLTT